MFISTDSPSLAPDPTDRSENELSGPEGPEAIDVAAEETQPLLFSLKHRRNSSVTSLPTLKLQERWKLSIWWRLLQWVHSYLLFGFFGPWMKLAGKKGIAAVRAELLPELRRSDRVDRWSRRFIDAARRQWERPRGPQRHALLVCLLSVFWKHFLVILTVSVLDVALQGLSIGFTGKFLAQIESSKQSKWWIGIYWALGAVAIDLFNIFFKAHLAFWKERVALRVEGALGTGLFYRTLTPSQYRGVRPTAGSPSTYNVLMLDVPSVARAVYILAQVLTYPFVIATAFGVLSSQVGPPAFVALGVTVAATLIVIGLEIWTGLLKGPLLAARDVRIARTHEALREVKALRMMGWEGFVEEDIAIAREEELRVRTKRMYIHGVSWMTADNLRNLAKIAVITAYVLYEWRDGNYTFKASVAIPVIQIVVKLLAPLTNLSLFAHAIIESKVSLDRYSRAMFGEAGQVASKLRRADSPIRSLSPTRRWGRQKANSTAAAAAATAISKYPTTSSGDGGPLPEHCIQVRNAVCAWGGLPTKELDDREETELLHELADADTGVADKASPRAATLRFLIPHLDVGRGECVLLLGEAGSGKSSVLLSLLGETHLVYGHRWIARSSAFAKCEGKGFTGKAVGYASQVPWVPDGSVRSAILFGRPFDSERYARAIAACDLAHDLAAWEDGDQRLIMQGGSNLSGGQRTRVALARAVYDYPILSEDPLAKYKSFGEQFSGTSCFLLDDPFSAVDPRVGAEMFGRLFGFGGLLQHAASVVAMDEVSLRFFFGVLRAKPARQQGGLFGGVRFSVKVVENGVVRDAALSDYKADQVADATVILPEPAERQQQSRAGADSARISEATSAAEGVMESSFSGAVGWGSYLWYFRHFGRFWIIIVALLAILCGVLQLSSDAWVAHWTTMSGPEPLPLVTPGPVPAVPALPTPSPFPLVMSHPELEHVEYGSNRIPMERSALENSELGVPMESIDGEIVRRMESDNSEGSADQDLKDQPGGFDSEIPNNQGHGRNALAVPPAFSELEAVTGQAANEAANEEAAKRMIAALVVFLALMWSDIAGSAILAFLETWRAVGAARRIHVDLLSAVLRAPFWLYDYVSVGALLNRFSADILMVDVAPVYTIVGAFSKCSRVVLVIFFLCFLRPGMVPFVFLLILTVYFWVYRTYRPSVSEFQRSKLLAYSPYCEVMSEAESGHLIIRAFGVEGFYGRKNLRLTSNLIKAQYVGIGAQHWALLRLQLLSYPLTFLNYLFPNFLASFGLSGFGFLGGGFAPLSAGFIGLSVELASRVPQLIGEASMSVSLLDWSMCSLQRIRELTSIGDGMAAAGASVKATSVEPEAESEALLMKSVSKTTKHVITNFGDFPKARSGLRLHDLSVAYERIRPCSDMADGSLIETQYGAPVLKRITAEAGPHARIGIVGRTGAGKSTLLLSLMDLVPATNGLITLDGVPLTSISPAVREELIGVLPQMPVVLKGWTIAKFLDPYGTFGWRELRGALERVGMAKIVAGLPHGLETEIVAEDFVLDGAKDKSLRHCGTFPEGEMPAKVLSDSQLRMLSLARLTLRADRYRLVLVDEPPARQLECSDPSVFGEDATIGQIIQSIFPQSTVIIVAHQASTVRCCETVWILSQGSLVGEVPGASLTNQDSLMAAILKAEERAAAA